MTTKSTKTITPDAVLSYPHIAAPQESQDGKPAKYSCALVFTPELLADPKNKAKLDAMKQAAVDAAKAKWGAKAEALLKSQGFRTPFRTDAADKGYPEGSVFINVRSAQQPGTVYSHADSSGKPAQIPQDAIAKELYAGAIVRASVAAFAYDNSGNKGVSFGLNNIQKIRDGERLDGRVSAQNEFEADLSQKPADLSDIM